MMTISSKNAVCYFILLLLVSFFVFGTHPFLRIPYDPWEHLIKIRSIFDTGSCFLYWPESKSSFCSWHWAWATLFSLLHISDTFVWASIIHYTQFFFALFCLFYFSYTVLNLCGKNGQKGHIVLASCFATLFWLVGNGTYSVDFQQAWIMWYSVTYQGVTIPLFWLITGLTLNLFFNEGLRPVKKPFYCVFIALGFLAIAFFHPSEAIYFVIFLVLSLFITPHVSVFKKIVFGIFLLLVSPLVLYSIAFYLKLPFLNGVSLGDGLIPIIEKISVTGEKIVAYRDNRMLSTLSELAIVSMFAAAGYWLFNILIFRKNPTRLVYLLSIALVIFFLIPTNKWFAGLTGVLLHEDIVWRFFFASPWFLFVPLIVFKIARNLKFAKTSMFMSLMSILLVTIFASQFYFSSTLYGNVCSLRNSLANEKVGVQYSDATIEDLGRIVEREAGGVDKERVMLYIRGDLATLARGVHGFYAYSHRRVMIPMHKFLSSRLDRKYTLVPVSLPVGFPKDRNIFRRFKLDGKNISNRQTIVPEGDHPVLFTLEHVDVGSVYVWIRGWAILKGRKKDSVVSVVLQSDQETVVYDTSPVFRRDVARRFKSDQLENSGFLATINISELTPGLYQIGLLARQNGQQGFVVSERFIELPRYYFR